MWLIKLAGSSELINGARWWAGPERASVRGHFTGERGGRTAEGSHNLHNVNTDKDSLLLAVHLTPYDSQIA